jgi:hypothetical protein
VPDIVGQLGLGALDIAAGNRVIINTRDYFFDHLPFVLSGRS